MLPDDAMHAHAPREFRKLAYDAPPGDSSDAALLRAILNNETLDLTALYTIEDLLVLNAAAVGDAGIQSDQAANLRLLLCALQFALGEGGLCLRVDNPEILAELLDRLTAHSFADPASISDPRISDRLMQRAQDLIGFVRSPAFEALPLVAVFRINAALDSPTAAFRPLVYESEAGFLYFQKHFEYKHTVARKVAAFFARPVTAAAIAPVAIDELRPALREVLDTRPVRGGADRKPLRMAGAQQLAILLGMIAASGGSARENEAPGDSSAGGFLIVTGGPGTGKTSTVLNLLRGLARRRVSIERISLAAPTGRAARRLTESLQSGLASIADPAPEDLALGELRGATLHQLLRFSPAMNRFAQDESNPLDVDVLIVDEVSMVDAALMAHLLSAIDVRRTLLVFLGDRDQLPSVDAGAVLADFLRLLAPQDQAPLYSPAVLQLARDLLPDFAARESEGADAASDAEHLTDRIVQLTESFRSGDAILNAAAAINAGRSDAVFDAQVLPELPASPDDGEGPSAKREWPAAGCFRIALPGGDTTATHRLREGVVLDWLRTHFDADYLRLARTPLHPENPEEATEHVARVFAGIHRSRILAVVRRGRSGVAGINRIAVNWLASRLGRASSSRAGGLAYFPGLPILIARNDHRRELYNGDVGVVLNSRTADGVTLRAFFERPGGRFASFPVAVLPEHEAAFALTVHKSQGSEYERVLILLPDDVEHRLLSREVIYTGLTRARRLAVICGPSESLATAVRRKLIRETGSLYAFDRS